MDLSFSASKPQKKQAGVEGEEEDEEGEMVDEGTPSWRKEVGSKS